MTRRETIAVVLAGLLAVASCSSDRGTDPSGETASGGGATDTTAADGSAFESFGTLDGPCGPRDPATAEPASTDPAETQGVSDGAIALGTVADPGFSGRPGLNQEIFDAAEAFVGWCNDQGGINGRRIQYTEYDAALTEYTPRLDEACGQEFAMVGSGAVTDDQWAETGRACGLLSVNVFNGSGANGGPAGPGWIAENRTFMPTPGPTDRFGPGAARLLAEADPGVMERAVLIGGDIAASIDQAARQVQALEDLGYRFVEELTYNVVGEANWSPFAAAIRDAEATYVTYIGEGANLALIQQALDEIGYEVPVTQVDTNLYDPAYLDAAGGAADGTYVRIGLWPFEEADQNPATRQYLDLVAGVDGKAAAFGVGAFSGWLLFTELARDCDVAGDLTRSCILDAAADVHEWTGGGLHGATDPGNNEPSPCLILMQVEDGGFVRSDLTPADEGGGFDCDPANLLEVDPPG